VQLQEQRVNNLLRRAEEVGHRLVAAQGSYDAQQQWVDGIEEARRDPQAAGPLLANLMAEHTVLKRQVAQASGHGERGVGEVAAGCPSAARCWRWALSPDERALKGLHSLIEIGPPRVLQRKVGGDGGFFRRDALKIRRRARAREAARRPRRGDYWHASGGGVTMATPSVPRVITSQQPVLLVSLMNAARPAMNAASPAPATGGRDP
jgi:hypothetical protein